MTSNCDNEMLFNKHIIKWLTEWRADCQKSGSKMQYVYSKALISFRQWKDPVKSGKDCIKIKQFGEKICKRIDRAIVEFKKANGITVNESNNECDSDSEWPALDEVKDSIISPQKKKSKTRDVNNAKKKPSKIYVPEQGSGGYAILVALYKADVDEFLPHLSKTELIARAQQYSNESMRNPKNGSYYTSFNSMSTLVKHEYVSVERHRNSHYMLTARGRIVANNFVRRLNGEPCGPINFDTIGNSEDGVEQLSDAKSGSEEDSDCDMKDDFKVLIEEIKPLQTCSESNKNRLCILPENVEVVLLVDNREQSANSGTHSFNRRVELLNKLHENGIKVESRSLPVGDFAWLARDKNYAHTKHTELVLDYVVERKTFDDLIRSIQDGRWREQKFRLKNCGLRKPTYLIEGENIFKKEKCVIQASFNAQISDGFNVKWLRDNNETITYLVTMTRCLESLCKEKSLYTCAKEELEMDNSYFITYTEFEIDSKKIIRFTSREMFAKHLLQFHGVSVDKVSVIIEHYPTVTSLLDAYSLCETAKQKENLLSNLEFGNLSRKIGPATSKKVFEYYGKF